MTTTRTPATRLDVRSTDGTPIAVCRSGVGKPLVLVHGTTADHTRWAPVLSALEAGFCVLALDRRGDLWRGRHACQFELA